MLPKLLLSFDTSAAHCAAALAYGDDVLADRCEEMPKGQAERLFPMLEEVLAEAGKTWSDLDAIGVGIGPGNFTGVRLSVSAARGLALSLDCPAIGVSVLEAMAFGTDGRRLVSLDARRDQLYTQVFDGDVAEDPELVSFDELPTAARADVAQACIGYRAAEIAEVCGGAAMEQAVSTPVAIAHLAASRLDQDNPRPAPLYLRAADAALPSEPPVVILP